MRLIDADKFIGSLNSGGGESVEINISKRMPLGEIVDTVIQAYRKCLFAELEKAPTAYDVDKVVGQLEKLMKVEYEKEENCDEDVFCDGEQIYDDGISQGKYAAYIKAVEIVKFGGIE